MIFRGKAINDETAAQLVKELKPKHPVFAEIIERGHEGDSRRSDCS
jgi:hypothetical protein